MTIRSSLRSLGDRSERLRGSIRGPVFPISVASRSLRQVLKGASEAKLQGRMQLCEYYAEAFGDRRDLRSCSVRVSQREQNNALGNSCQNGTCLQKLQGAYIQEYDADDKGVDLDRGFEGVRENLDEKKYEYCLDGRGFLKLAVTIHFFFLRLPLGNAYRGLVLRRRLPISVAPLLAGFIKKCDCVPESDKSHITASHSSILHRPAHSSNQALASCRHRMRCTLQTPCKLFSPGSSTSDALRASSARHFYPGHFGILQLSRISISSDATHLAERRRPRRDLDGGRYILHGKKGGTGRSQRTNLE